MKIKFEEIVPVGNFDSILEKFRELVDETISECHKNKKYSSRIAEVIKFIVGEFATIEALEDGIKSGKIWDLREASICLLYTHLLIIDLNDTAQLYLNNIKMETPKDQLKRMIKDSEKDSVYRGITII